MNELHVDLCVIGGGINGAAIARDAAGRGLSVVLVEAADLAGATSSASTKLIHGGIRYLENYEFSMVSTALREREILYKNASHLIWPIECALPHDTNARPKWMVRLGVWIYDRLGGKNSLPLSKVINFDETIYGAPLKEKATEGVVYSDCCADDTRLVILNAVDAASYDAKILTHTVCDHLAVQDGKWQVGLRDTKTNEQLNLTASMVVNATGPWVGQFLENVGVAEHDPDLPNVRLVKGSHIILPKQYEGSHAYVLQQADKRIIFVAPYQDDYTLVGTTEEDYEGNPRDVRISDAEMVYLCDAFSTSFENTVTPSDVIFTYSGIRPLLDDGHKSARKVTRDYKIYHHKRYDPPFLSVFGGKLTTHRSLAEGVVDRLMRLSGRTTEGWTAKRPLAGGDLGEVDFKAYLSKQAVQYPFLPKELIYRYARAYGTRMDYFLHNTKKLSDLGVHHGDHVFQVEIDYLINHEWAQTAEDIIWRRSKLGLHILDETLGSIEALLHSRSRGVDDT